MFVARQSARSRAIGRKDSRRKWLWKATLLSGFSSLARAHALASQATSNSGGRRKSPSLLVRTIEGQTVAIEKRPGKVVLVDIMTTTCPSCKMASAGIQKLYQQLGGKGFLPVAIAVDQQAPNLLAFYRNLYRLTFPIGVTSREDILAYLKLPANKPLMVPTLVLLDKRGRICETQVGWTGEDQLRVAIIKLLGERA
jgi:thiol-disulfide isomerase/thioredoxin